MLLFMGSQRVRQDLVTEQKQQQTSDYGGKTIRGSDRGWWRLCTRFFKSPQRECVRDRIVWQMARLPRGE